MVENPPPHNQAPPAVQLLRQVYSPSSPHCEHLVDGELRHHWNSLSAVVDELKPDGLGEKFRLARRMRREDGAAYNPFATEEEKLSYWPMDILPLPLVNGEWQILERGLRQRAELLEQVVADAYGPQQLMRDGVVPAELVYANPHFLRSCYGLQPLQKRFLTFISFDLYRGADGRFRVYRDNCNFIEGLGFSLENRIVTSRLFSSLYQRENVLRLAPFFHSLQQHLNSLLSHSAADASIVILSPGQDNPLYFEHALLSRYLGYPLVESQDLTVRDGQVFLKKLAGLELVEVIVRHVEDNHIDPFVLRKGGSHGIAGILQAVREQKVMVVNTPGSSYGSVPALSCFLPAICRKMRSEELYLDSHPSLWCGEEKARAHVMAQQDIYELKNAFDYHGAIRDDLDLNREKNPYTVLAREKLAPSSAPVFLNGQLLQNHVLFRVFGAFTGEGFSLMPGALAMVSAASANLAVNDPKVQHSKDVWVVADHPVEPFSMMEDLQKVTEIRRSSDLPSRVADNFLWLGRYLERAEDTLRLLRAVYRRLVTETRPQETPELPFLLSLLQARGMLGGNHGKTDNGLPPLSSLVVHVHDALFRRELSGSVVNVLSSVQATARRVRDRLSPDSWRVITRLDDFLEGENSDLLDLQYDTLFTLNSFSGLAMEGMTRGLGWRFMDMGRRLERAMSHAEMFEISMQRKCFKDTGSLEALLEVADAIMTYRSRYRATFQLAPVLDLLLVDETNPKSLVFQLKSLSEHVEALPRSSEKKYETVEEKTALAMLTGVRLLDLRGTWDDTAECNLEPVIDFLADIRVQLKEFSQSITAHYLSRIPSTPHFSIFEGEV